MKNIHITYISHISKYVTYVQIICYFYLGNQIMSKEQRKVESVLSL